ncbi:hypothetical protein HLH34_13395 [Gluconacetobacter azotocaptans]|uniref:Rap1a immunity protein domain-containing protein n=1 Tax=Gluconacetobacter azotocaptans TaxID=142834 RepID=A0A7W4JU61_9PROT|nr:Rap1a/Tai family immunity protein [Gluconacetobacter azotocaptans]MBB2190945.1 hypothetical protein [Gluconacetobacter azotocaptans]MBM9401698.1 hypothetical protein [Gluconacetobacter azotocaptans]GBQ31823.1 hypothetical protein AA13594_2199 [Gluconacetobacter azotocaptans DSM 13594]
MTTGRSMLLLAAGLTFGLPASSALAQRVSPLQGGRFLQLCSRAPSIGICDAYISGVADAVALTHVYDKNEGDKAAPTGFCVASGVTSADMRSKVVAWLKGHTDKLTSPVGGLVFTALHESYPCGGSK